MNAAEGEQNNSEFTTLRLSESKDRSRALPSKSKVKPRRGLTQNAKFTINGFSSRVRFQRCHSEEQSDEESVSSAYRCLTALRLSFTSLRRAAATVMLSAADRRTPRAHSPSAAFGSQGKRFFAPLRMTIMASMSRRLFLFLIRKTLRPGPARIEDATPAAGPGEHLNEFPNGNDSMQRQHCHSEEIGRSTKNL